jgi:hypothetical protein
MPEILKNGSTVVNGTRIGNVRVLMAITPEGNQYATWIEGYQGTTFGGTYFEWPHMYDTQEDAYIAAYRDFLARVREEQSYELRRLNRQAEKRAK